MCSFLLLPWCALHGMHIFKCMQIEDLYECLSSKQSASIKLQFRLFFCYFSRCIALHAQKENFSATTKEKHFVQVFSSSSNYIIQNSVFRGLKRLCRCQQLFYESAPYTITINLFGSRLNKMVFLVLVFFHFFFPITFTAVIEWVSHTKTHIRSYMHPHA